MKFYAVKVGRIPGVYTTWNECSRHVTGFNGAIYKSFPTLQEAEAYIGIQNNQIKKYGISIENSSQSSSDNLVYNIRKINENTENIENRCTWEFDSTCTIFVDGGYNRHTAPNAYGSVTNHKGFDLIEGNKHLLRDLEIVRVELPVGVRELIVCNFGGVSQQNNGAELMAMVAGLRIALHYISNHYKIKNIASDSQLIVEYWSKGRYKRDGLDSNKIFYIEELKRLREIFESYGGVIQKISADSGNPADLGYHVNK